MGVHTADWLAQEAAKQFGYVLEAMTAQHFATTASKTAAGAPSDLSWWDYELSGPVSGRAYVGAGSASADGLGGAILSAAGVEADPENSKSTFFELATQVLSGLAQGLSAKIGRPVDSSPRGTDTPEPSAQCAAVEVRGPQNLSFTVYVAFGGGLLDSLQPAETPHAAQAQEMILSPGKQPNAPAPAQGGTLDLLMDVELPVSISFGRAQLQIKDVMKLASGSIVELNRHVAEPVEVIVNNCVIARGEVVVVEGNYGVRIQQIISPQDRLRTLR